MAEARQGAPTRRRGRAEVEPWYRQFWPWFLIVLPGSVVVAAVATLVIANRHADDLVVRDYYESGLAINRELEKRARAEALRLSASFDISDDAVLVWLDGTTHPPLLRLTLSHPLEADRDFSLTLRPVDAGTYLADLPAIPAPNWHWTLDAGPDSGWRLDGSLASGDFSGALRSG